MLSGGMEACPGYKLTKRLGQGGFGEVWEAVGKDSKKVALKFLNLKHQPTGAAANEIKLLVTLRDLQHPHLIQLLSIHTAPNHIILCMELADGSLNDLHFIYREDYKTNIPPQVLIGLLSQAASALDFMADQKVKSSGLAKGGLQHCDVKPSNLLLVGNSVKVADFGLSGPLMWGDARGTRIGTPPYAAPELYEGKPSERTDQYGLAVTYYELRTGFMPYPPQKEFKFPEGNPDLSQLPENERMVIAKAMSRRWLDRWPNCTTLMNSLREAVENSATQPQPKSKHSSTHLIQV